MKKVTAILNQRGNDYHIYVEDNTEIWDCGKTLKQAIENFKRTAKSHNREMERLEVDINTITEIAWQ